MSLPIPARKRGVLHFHGEDIALRSLTARELTDLRLVVDVHDVNVQMIAYSFDMPFEEAKAWYDAVDASDVLAVMEAINTVSGIGQGAQFPRRAANDAGDGGSAV